VGGELAVLRGALAATAAEVVRAEVEWAGSGEALQEELSAKGDEIEVWFMCFLA
jgi:hypothetical protein